MSVVIANMISDAHEGVGRIGCIPVRNLWLLMLYASDLFRDLEKAKVAVEDNPDDIPDLVAEILCRKVERRIKRNLSYGYRPREAVLGRVRGRIELLNTERHQLLDRGKVACRFDELTVDTTRNRFVRSALEEISKIVRHTVRDYIKQFESGGTSELFDFSRKETKIYEAAEYKDKVFQILHSPPSYFKFNRTAWRLEDLYQTMKTEGFPLSKANITKIIKNAGYKFIKAKKVLTSNDPLYREKLQEITTILSNLKPNEKFFSIDEFGPLAIKIRGGRSWTPPEDHKIFPQWQQSKGSLIVTAALELSTNQITHFYSAKKNTTEMIALLDILLKQYKDEARIFFSWDGASWHASRKLYDKVQEVNAPEYRNKHNTPRVELAPLPSSAQFLNVIESVFSGMAKAIIHNSNYQSVDECKLAINRYFFERNQAFLERPKRAGKKIWGQEVVKPVFKESNNCKDSHYR